MLSLVKRCSGETLCQCRLELMESTGVLKSQHRAISSPPPHFMTHSRRCSKPSSRSGADKFCGMDFGERVLERRYASTMNSKQQRQQKPRDPIRAN
ncbi:hypothetical protein NC652_002441 [Populus alba x Populus x berolinensis]|nr:hypothetical protein NC652_002441 [Populus alba x Populus x berolinensis]